MKQDSPLSLRYTQISTITHPAQGSFFKALFVCSAGILRSATAAYVFSQEPYNWNTRSAGASQSYALNQVNEALLDWADVIFCMEKIHGLWMSDEFGKIYNDRYLKKVKVLDIADVYDYRSPELISLLQEKVKREIIEKY